MGQQIEPRDRGEWHTKSTIWFLARIPPKLAEFWPGRRGNRFAMKNSIFLSWRFSKRPESDHVKAKKGFWAASLKVDPGRPPNPIYF